MRLPKFNLTLISFILLLTNVWVVVYISLLNIFNLYVSSLVSDIYYRPAAVLPEPLEIPLYLGLTILFSLISIILYPRIENLTTRYKIPPFIQYIILILLIIAFIQKLGMYPLANSLEPYKKTLSIQSVITLWVMWLFTLLALSIVPIFISVFSKVKKLKNILLMITVIGIIALLTFEPRFPISYVNYSFFFGPVWEILSGKTIYTQVPSQYGFVSILFLALLHSSNIVNILQLPVLIWILTVIEFFLCFYLFFKTSRSVALSLVGLLSILTIHYFSYLQSPQAGPLRWLPIVLSLALANRFKSLHHKRFIALLAPLCFWFIDSGISLALGFVTTILLLALLKRNIKETASTIVFFLASLALFIAGIISTMVILGYQIINLSLIFSKLNQYSRAGFGMIPIEYHSYFWLVIFLYFISLFLVFKKREQFSVSLAFFSANCMLFASSYYVGRSAADYLFKISIFPLITFFLLLGLEFKSLPRRQQVLTLTSLIFLLIIFPSFERKEALAEMLAIQYKTITKGSIFTPEAYQQVAATYNNEASLIKSEISDKKTIILSADDTYLFLLTGKKNLLDANPLSGVDTKAEMKKAIKNAHLICPDKIIIDCSLIGHCIPYETLTSSWTAVLPVILTEIQNSCGFRYQPVKCTNKLCVAEKK